MENVLRDGNRFFLCDCREGVEQHFIAHGKGVDSFFFKDDANTEQFELSYIFQRFLDIAGEPRDRFCNYKVDLLQLAHGDHPLKVFSFFG